MAPALGWLVAFRALQAVGGSMLNPVAMSIITNVFTDPRERAQAIGVWGGVVGISLALGPVIGGALVESIGWRSIFWINVPVGLAAIVLTLRFVPESRAARARRPDPVGQLLVLVMLGSLTYAIIEGPGHGWSSPEIIGLFGLSVLCLAAFIAHSRRRVDPLIELRFFRSIPFSAATLIAIFAFGGLGGFLFLNTLYLQEARGLSALMAGLYTLPMAATAMIFGPVSGRMVASRGARPSLLLAGICMPAATLLLTQVTPTTSTALLFFAYALFGVGFGAVNAPITNTAVSGMPNSQAGVASAIASTSRQVGQSLGIAVVGAAVSVGLGAALGPSFAAASHVGWWIVTGCGVGVLVLGLVSTSRRARESAARTARYLEEPPGPAPATRGRLEPAS